MKTSVQVVNLYCTAVSLAGEDFDIFSTSPRVTCIVYLSVSGIKQKLRTMVNDITLPLPL